MAAAEPEPDIDGIAALSIGRRDARLLELRTRLFGDVLVGLATCAACGELLELEFSASDLMLGPASAPDEPAILRTSGYELRVRLLNSRDLDGIAQLPDVAAGRDTLLRSCVLGASRDGTEVPADQLPALVLDLIEEWLAAADPQADIEMALHCPGCAATWRQGFDIVSFLWAEIDAWARRTLYDVHRLATAYGWREGDILAMSAPRRQAYLDLVGT
ncbi:hypothetical protein ACFZBZ_15435 [Streptomyces sp. NPDC008196]|uniref:hypothetical protein n=1 Tax=Streptomyces sp. NPDC008196 TaxID=3364819 RepID=UPI0036F056E4